MTHPAFVRNADRSWCDEHQSVDLPIRVEVSPGELIDRITIVAIKSERLGLAEQRTAAKRELVELRRICALQIPGSQRLEELESALWRLNARLWRYEAALRKCEKRAYFGRRFVALARLVYLTNDQRFLVKCEINALLGSRLLEEKEWRTRP